MKKLKAFTLIELLVCLAIIAVLVALLLPAIANSKKNLENRKKGLPSKEFVVGDTVYATIGTQNVTGTVAWVYYGRCDVDFISTNGIPVQFKEFRNSRLHRVVQPIKVEDTTP